MSAGSDRSGPNDEVLLEVRGLVKHFTTGGSMLGRSHGTVRAVDGVSFRVRTGETLGLVGESGCGKSTLGRSVLRLIEPTAGEVLWRGRDLLSYRPSEMRAVRREMQIVFQDPYSSLNPRLSVGAAVEEGLIVHGIGSRNEREAAVARILERVGLLTDVALSYPHELSGGQRQRVGIARALVFEPRFVVCDEPVSALDVSIRAQVLALLEELRDELGLAYLFISHDVSVVRSMSDHIAVMYAGEIVESATADELHRQPLHPYTQALLAAVPVPDPSRDHPPANLQGDPPSPHDPPAGCRFHPRCPLAVPGRCDRDRPRLEDIEGRQVACHLVSG